MTNYSVYPNNIINHLKITSTIPIEDSILNNGKRYNEKKNFNRCEVSRGGARGPC